ncbi:hypothetical protein GF351_04330 [Candidatus Woesearchaeota archaeon]|nr:hypothetical protein [Candidatus Woesearchaeota archaeon]
MIKKKTIFIISGGRTGTKFFARLFQKVLPDCVSCHEPDTLYLRSFSLEHYLFVFRHFGFFSSGFGKLFGKRGMRSLSNHNVTGTRARKDIVNSLRRQREDFVNSFPQEFYVESNNQLYGLVDIIPEVFSNYRIICIVRDGKDWVRSRMNHKIWFSRTDIMNLFGKRLNPHMFSHGQQKFQKTWNRMSRFEKICWSWVQINRFQIEMARKDKNATVVRFEDIFKAKDRYKNLEKLLEFATSMDNRPILGSWRGILEKRINVSKKEGGFPGYKHWSDEQKRQFHDICGSLMQELGYK